MAERPTGYLTEQQKASLLQVSTATITTQLFRRGVTTGFMEDVRPLRPDLRMVGYAYTLRYIPMREDLGRSPDFDNTTNPQRLAIEAVGPDDVLVVDAGGRTGGAVLGDILITRMLARGATGVVTDGSFRDSPGVAQIGLPAYARAMHAYMSSIVHFPVGLNEPVGCGGVAVIPGDVIVGDAEGVVVIPRAMASEVAEGALEQEAYEAWAMKKIEDGEAIHGIYPPSDETRAEFEAWRANQSASGQE